MATGAARQSLTISQKDHYAGNFGDVYRSSALFWARSDEHLKTTVSLTNYWKYKNNTDVAVVLNLRDMGGKLLGRQRVDFADAEVFNYTAPFGFAGSVEVEAFAAKNLRIPYAAVMGVYEAADSVSMVHSYSRAYSQHEIEDGRTITVGEEGCWTLRDDARLTSFCVLHNGAATAEAQTIRLSVRRATGEERIAHVELPPLQPFQTVLLEPKQHMPGLIDWLAGEPGNARISFRVAASFTRLLCGVRCEDGSQLQVTHSNFDYSTHRTDHLTGPDLQAYMLIPRVLAPSTRREVVIYPDADPGSYSIESAGARKSFTSGKTLAFHAEGDPLIFRRKDGTLPSRIVTGVRLHTGGHTIPAECSMGVAHAARPRKHFAWMLVAGGDSEVSWVDYRQVYGGCTDDAEVVFHLYTPDRKEPSSTRRRFGELPGTGVLPLRALFDEPLSSFGYLTAWCSYGGLQWFSALKKNGSITIEHAF